MVVDIRYHLASIIAIFLALGLGILVGTALSDGEGLDQQEKWLSSLEGDLQQMRERRKETAALLERTGEERDRYERFAAQASEALVKGILKGEKASLVILGPQRDGHTFLDEVLQNAGAAVVRRVHIKPDWQVADTGLLTLLTPLDTRRASTVGAAIADVAAGVAADRFTAIESPQIWFKASGEENPTLLILVLDGDANAYQPLMPSFLSEVESYNRHLAAVITPGSGWEALLERADIPYVTHVGSPMGQLSLALLLANGGHGGYGFGDDRPMWPANLLNLYRSEVKSP